MAARDEALAGQVNLGRTAALGLQCINEIIEDMSNQIIENAISAHRAGELDPTRALVAWGKIDAISGLRETLENRVMSGEAAALQLTTLRGGQPT